MKAIYRIMGKRGRITIPYETRVKVGFAYNDILSFVEGSDGKSVVVRRERICDNCVSDSGQTQIPGFAEPKPQKKQNNKISGARKTLKLMI